MRKPYFVYGTLKPGGRYWPRIESRVESHHDATIEGFDLFGLHAGFPAIIPGDGTVDGVLIYFRPEDADDAIATMDQIEGWDPDSQNPLYRPAEVEAITDEGRVWATTYVWGSGSREELESRGSEVTEGFWAGGES